MVGDAGLDLALLVRELVQRGLALRHGLGVLLRRPLRLLARDLRLRGEVGVVLGERPHELETIGELREARGPQEHVELRSHPRVRRDRALGQLGRGSGGDGVGGVLGLFRVEELRLGLLQAHLGLVVLLDHLVQLAVEGVELRLGGLDLRFRGGGR